MIRDKIVFSLEGSLTNLQGQEVPNFSRPSPVWLERYKSESLQLYPVETHYPAIYAEDGSFLIEPSGVNLINHNMDAGFWYRGSNVNVRRRAANAPIENSHEASRISWFAWDQVGDGSSQVLRKPLFLRPQKSYYLSAILSLSGGVIGGNDVIRIMSVEAISGIETKIAEVKLGDLNNFPNRYRLCELAFDTTGQSPTLPIAAHSPERKVIEITPSTVVIEVPNDTVVADQLAGASATFSSDTTRKYIVAGNTPSDSDGNVTIFFGVTTLVANNVAINDSIVFGSADDALINVEFFVENPITLNFGGIQLEEGKFRTSMIYQNATLNLRAASKLTYRFNPIGGLRTFGIFLSLKEWRGDGNLINLGNIRAFIYNGQLQVKTEKAIVIINSPLPPNSDIFIQVDESLSSLFIYIDGYLKGRLEIEPMVGDPNAYLDLTSLGIRSYRRIAVMDQLITGGTSVLNELATGEVADLFEAQVLIDAHAISSNAPLIILPPVTVPAKEAPIAKAQITTLIDPSQQPDIRYVHIGNNSAFLVNTTVSILRGNVEIATRLIIEKRGTQFLELDSTQGLLPGDAIVYGYTSQPGKASVRLPFVPIDTQRIVAVNTNYNWITVESCLSFRKERAFVHTEFYQDVAEVIVYGTDPLNNTLVVNSAIGIEPGNFISQPLTETRIDPSNYFAKLLNTIANVSVKYKYSNGLVIENNNYYSVECRPCIRVYL
ncbi:MAG: hypothetical protein WBB28_01375 [Crinalium sp.]